MKIYKKKTPVSENWLYNNCFRYSNIYSDKDNGDAYFITFPCYKWNNHITLVCEAVVWINDGSTLINVFDANTGGRSRYAPWYLQCESHKRLLDIIDNNITKTLTKVGFKYYDDDNNKPMREVYIRNNRRNKQSKN